jgi:hypothetical protein
MKRSAGGVGVSIFKMWFPTSLRMIGNSSSLRFAEGVSMRFEPFPWFFLSIGDGDIYLFHLEIGRFSVCFERKYC